jgi:hypothetical protein
MTVSGLMVPVSHQAAGGALRWIKAVRIVGREGLGLFAARVTTAPMRKLKHP